MKGIFPFLMILLLSIFVLVFEPNRVNALVITVPDDYSTIQEAINNANDGDTVFVRASNYDERIILNVSISLIGEARETTIIDVRGVGNPLEIQANGTIVSGFTFSYGGVGVALTDSHNNLIENNKMRKNSRGIGGALYTNTTLENNIVTENDYGIDFGQLFGPASKNNTARSNEIHHNTNAGIYVSASEGNNSIIWNSIHDNAFGIVLDHTQNNDIFGNLIDSNTYGFYMRNAIQDKLEQNQLQGNVAGIHLENSNDNVVFHNNFESNTVQVEGASYNTWDNGYPSGGNHWSSYSGLDLYSGPSQNLTGSDGIGDSAYTIDADNVDRYPLMQQHIIPEFPLFLVLPLFMIATLLAALIYRRKHKI